MDPGQALRGRTLKSSIARRAQSRASSGARACAPRDSGRARPSAWRPRARSFPRPLVVRGLAGVREVKTHLSLGFEQSGRSGSSFNASSRTSSASRGRPAAISSRAVASDGRAVSCSIRSSASTKSDSLTALTIRALSSRVSDRPRRARPRPMGNRLAHGGSLAMTGDGVSDSRARPDHGRTLDSSTIGVSTSSLWSVASHSPETMGTPGFQRLDPRRRRRRGDDTTARARGGRRSPPPRAERQPASKGRAGSNEGASCSNPGAGGIEFRPPSQGPAQPCILHLTELRPRPTSTIGGDGGAFEHSNASFTQGCAQSRCTLRGRTCRAVVRAAPPRG